MPSWTDRRHTNVGDGGRRGPRPLRRFWPRRTLTAALVLCGLLCPLSLLVAVQDAPTVSPAKPTTYRLSGVVLDSARAPVLEAEVTLIEAGVGRPPVVNDSAGGLFPRGANPGSNSPPARPPGSLPAKLGRHAAA